ncbi:Peptidase family M28 [Seinonella peptonophila]|uniref:Peptidase family M28 n=1 Tax=Seinonella peptonophila TaxID=112248 RepID=A0A1M4X2U1_9BACL|nr:M20/M25/M40 family metallo-hydrolase [Seinonella peptonophila]SHE87809.1 Peptidase family M28 [Seinonella peptonophila]
MFKVLKIKKTRAVCVLIMIFVFAVLSLSEHIPPKPVSKTAPDTDFSAERALIHLQKIAKEPHPTGTIQNEKVREYLVEQLNLMGLNPKVEHSNYSSLFPKMLIGGDIYNVVSKLEGTQDGKAIVIAAHYDSVQHGPGAGDDGAGVAALLETIRALKASTPLKNDIYFVFTDGEEQGLMGAREFWKRSNRTQNIGLFINFEARGTKGPSIMFQTSKQNGGMIQEFAKATSDPVTTSFLGNLFQIMPNDSDMTVSNELGIPGLNFAFGDGWTGYHTPQDDIEHLDLRSLQQHGENALNMATHFGEIDIDHLKKEDYVYFNLFGLVIHYSYYWVYPITGLILLLFIGSMVLAVKKKWISIKGIGVSLLAIVISMLTAALLCVLVWMGVSALWAKPMTLFTGAVYDSNLYQFSFLALTIGICMFIWNRFRSINQLEMTFTAMLFGVIFLGLSSQFLPGASYLFAGPLLVHLLIIGWQLLRNRVEQSESPSLVLLVTLSCLPVMLFTPIISLLFTFFPVALTPYLMIVVVWILALLFMQIKIIAQLGRLTTPLLVGIAVILLGICWFYTSPSPDKPIDSHLLYVMDQDKQQAKWVSTRPPDNWSKQFVESDSTTSLKDILPFNYDKEAWTGNAPLEKVHFPKVAVTQKKSIQEKRKIHFRISGDQNIQNLYLMIPNQRIQSVKVENESSQVPSNMKTFYYKQNGIPKNGLNLEIEIIGNQPIQITFAAERFPYLPIRTKRPNYLMTSGLFDESMFIIKRFTY